MNARHTGNKTHHPQLGQRWLAYFPLPGSFSIVLLILAVVCLLTREQLLAEIRTNAYTLAFLSTVGAADREQLLQVHDTHDFSTELTLSQSIPDPPTLQTAGALSLSVLHAVLRNNHQAAATIATSHPQLCAARSTCRLLAGKATFITGNETATRFFWHHELLWNDLVRGTPPIPENSRQAERLWRYYNLLRDIYPDRPQAYFLLASFLRSSGRWQESVPFFQQALERDTENGRYLCSLGEALVRAEIDSEKGVALCQEGLAQDPSDMWLYLQMARTLAATGACDQALEVYLLAVERFPARSEPRQWLSAYRASTQEQCAGKAHAGE